MLSHPTFVLDPKLFALKAGIAESDIWIEDRSVNTEQNFKFSKAILEEMKMKEVVVISDPLHMRRAIFLAEKYGIKAESSATPFSFFDTNRKKLFFLLMELPKYQLSRLKHLFG